MPYSFIEDIYKSSLKFLDNLTPEETYAQIVEEAIKLVRAECGSIFLARNNNLERVYSTIPVKTQINPRKRGFTFKAYSEQSVVIVSYKEILKQHPEFEKSNFKDALINHTFIIENIVVPEELKKEKDFAKIREMSKRKGKIIREGKIDGQKIKTEMNFEA